MTIAFAFEIFFPSVNGVISSTLNLAENLLQRGHKVLFFAPKRHNSPAMLFAREARVHFLPSIPSLIYPDLRFCWPHSKVPRRMLQLEKVDILHITGPSTVAAASKRAAHKLGIPVVHTWHTLLNDPKYLQHLVRFKWLVPIAEKLSWKYYQDFLENVTMTTPAGMIHDLLLAHYPELEVQVISNGVDLRLFENPRSYAYTQKSFPGFNQKTFVFIGRVSQEKSIDTIIRAIGMAQKIDDEIRLFIVGDGPHLPQLRLLAKELTKKNSVIFTGRIMQKDIMTSGLLHYARAFLTASTSEVQSIALIESICCRTPVIAAQDQANSDVVGRGGILVEPGNVRGFSNAILKIIRDPSLYPELQGVLEDLIPQFNGVTVATQFEKLYLSLL